MKKIKLLITDTAPLYPPLWGGPKRIWNLYSNFPSEVFDITYVGISFFIKGGLKYQFNRINNNFKEILCGPPSHHRYWYIFNQFTFKNTSLDLFLYLWTHTDWHFRHVLKAQNPDITICSHPWSTLSLPKAKGKFFIYDAHNCEYLLMAQILKRHPLKIPVLRQVKRIENDACRKSDLLLVCSEKEKGDFLELYRIDPAKIRIVPNGTNIDEHKNASNKADFRKSRSILLQDKVVVFVGAYYKPNIEAATAIIEKIALRLKSFIFIIAGTVCDALKSVKMPDNVRLFGQVNEEELDLILNASDIAVNPMFNGSGINIKMLDYMSHGLPIVTTPTGARGIELSGKKPMIIAEIENFPEEIDKLAKDRELCNMFCADGRSLIAQRYDWQKISRALQEEILKKFG